MGGLLILISMVTGTVAFPLTHSTATAFLVANPQPSSPLCGLRHSYCLPYGGSLLPVPTPETQPEESALRGVTDTEVASEATGVVADREEDPDAMNIGNNEQETPCIPRKLSPALVERVP